MGTKVAPVYATLVLGYIEEKLFQEISNKYGEEFGNTFSNSWKRFLDDIFTIWPKSKTALMELEDTLNSLHPDLKFILQYSYTEISFLDVLIKKEGKQISTDIYYKPTDSKQYLLFQSCHPKHTRENIPFSLARRLCCIISDENILKHRLEELHNFLITQKYPTTLIINGIERAVKLNQQELRTVTDKPKEDVIAFVSTHNPNNLEYFNIITDNLPILENDDKMGNILKKHKLLKSKRQPANLKKLITKARFSERKQNPEIRKCQSNRCGLCKHLKTGNQYIFNNGRTFKIKFSANCLVENVIYALKCNGCQKDYIGETTNLRNRVTLHNQHIRHPNLAILPVSRHITKCAANKDIKFNIMPIYKMQGNDTNKRKSKESTLINILKPELNSK